MDKMTRVPAYLHVLLIYLFFPQQMQWLQTALLYSDWSMTWDILVSMLTPLAIGVRT